jgi:hypothetical protein
MKRYFLIITVLFCSLRGYGEESFADKLGEQIEGCPEGCSCITDINRDKKAKKRLGEVDSEKKLDIKTQEDKRRTRSK